MRNQKRLAFVIVNLFAVLALGACAKSEDKKSYSYQLTENGCATPTISTSSQDEQCAALKDDERNNRCARGLRYEKFKAECPGHQWN